MELLDILKPPYKRVVTNNMFVCVFDNEDNDILVETRLTNFCPHCGVKLFTPEGK